MKIKNKFLSTLLLVSCFALTGCGFNQGGENSSIQTSESEQLKVTFKFNNGKEDQVIYVDSSTNVELPNNLEKEGYIFVGWSDQDGNQWLFDQYQVTKDVVLTANWVTNSYVLHLDPNGGECEQSLVILSDNQIQGQDLASLLPEPVNGDLSFKGWLIYVEEVDQYLDLETAKNNYGYPLEKGFGPYYLQATYSEGADLSIWCNGMDVDFMEQAVDNFKKDYPAYANKTIEIISSDDIDVSEELKKETTNFGDVFHFNSSHFNELVSRDLLYEFNYSDLANIGIEEAVLDAGTFDEKQYSIPYSANTYFMYYDASVYSKEDILSFDQMLEVDVSTHGYQYNFSLDLSNAWYMQSYFFSNGCKIFGENGDDASYGIQPRDKADEVAHWMWEYLNGENRQKLTFSDFSYECGVSVAAAISGSWNAESIKTNIEAKGGIYAAAPLPKVDFGSGEVTWKSVGDFKHIGVSADTKSPDLATEFAIYLANKDSQALRYEMTNYYPTNLQTVNDSEYDWDESVIAQVKQIENTFRLPSIYEEQGFYEASVYLGTDLSHCTESEISHWFDEFLNSITKVD